MKESWQITIICLLLLCVAFAEIHASKVVYPEMKRDGTEVTYFEKKIPDPYGWMDKLSTHETSKLRQEQNNLTHSYLTSLSSHERATIRKTLSQCEQEALFEIGVIAAGTKLFLQKTLENTLYMTANMTDPEWKVISSSKNIPAACKHCEQMEAFNPNTFGDYVAVSFTTEATYHSITQSYFFMNTSSGKYLEDRIDNVANTYANSYSSRGVSTLNSGYTQWSLDGKGIYYLANTTSSVCQKLAATKTHVCNETFSIYYHKLGTELGSDVLVHSFTSKDSGHLFKLTSDGKHLILFDYEPMKGSNFVTFRYVTLCIPFPACVSKQGAMNSQTFYTTKHRIRFLGSKDSIFYLEETVATRNLTSYHIIAVDTSNNKTKNYKDAVLSQHDPQIEYFVSVLTKGNYLVTLTIRKKFSHYLHIRKLGMLDSGTKIPLEAGTPKIFPAENNLVAITFLDPVIPQSVVMVDLSSEHLEKIKLINLRLPGYGINSIRSNVVLQTITTITYKVVTRETNGRPQNLQMTIYRPNTIKLDGSSTLLLVPVNKQMSMYIQTVMKRFVSFTQIFGGVVAFPIIADFHYPSVTGKAWNEFRVDSHHNLKSVIDWLIENKYTCHEKLTLITPNETSFLGGIAITKYPRLLSSVILVNTDDLDLTFLFKTKGKMEEYLPISPIHNIQNLTHGSAVFLIFDKNSESADTGLKFITELQHQYTKDKLQNKPAIAMFVGTSDNSPISSELELELDVDMFGFLALSLGLPFKN